MGKTSKVLSKSGYSLEVPIQSKNPAVTDRGANGVADSASGALVGAEVTLDKQPLSVQKRKAASAPTYQWDERLSMVAGFSNKTAESFRVLRSKILLPQDGRPAPKTIMVTSALPREGKSFVTANLGIAFAQGVDQHALLVDCDLRSPSLAQLFGIPSERGLADYLQDKCDVSSLLHKTTMDKLTLLPSGVPPSNPADLLGSDRMHKFVSQLAARYPDRYVIFDTPPLEIASESKVLSQIVDGVILVVRQGISNKPLIEKFISEIGKDKIIGVIFNGHKSNFISTRLVDKSHYYYGNYYTDSGEKRRVSAGAS